MTIFNFFRIFENLSRFSFNFFISLYFVIKNHLIVPYTELHSFQINIYEAFEFHYLLVWRQIRVLFNCHFLFFRFLVEENIPGEAFTYQVRKELSLLEEIKTESKKPSVLKPELVSRMLLPLIEDLKPVSPPKPNFNVSSSRILFSLVTSLRTSKMVTCGFLVRTCASMTNLLAQIFNFTFKHPIIRTNGLVLRFYIYFSIKNYELFTNCWFACWHYL